MAQRRGTTSQLARKSPVLQRSEFFRRPGLQSRRKPRSVNWASAPEVGPFSYPGVRCAPLDSQGRAGGPSLRFLQGWDLSLLPPFSRPAAFNRFPANSETPASLEHPSLALLNASHRAPHPSPLKGAGLDVAAEANKTLRILISNQIKTLSSGRHLTRMPEGPQRKLPPPAFTISQRRCPPHPVPPPESLQCSSPAPRECHGAPPGIPECYS
jgi:hypothetical protein